jgi:hypothetical protein
MVLFACFGGGADAAFKYMRGGLIMRYLLFFLLVMYSGLVRGTSSGVVIHEEVIPAKCSINTQSAESSIVFFNESFESEKPAIVLVKSNSSSGFVNIGFENIQTANLHRYDGEEIDVSLIKYKVCKGLGNCELVEPLSGSYKLGDGIIEIYTILDANKADFKASENSRIESDITVLCY